MNEHFMVVGITAVNDETMKLELVPLVQTKNKRNILDIALGGDAQQIMKEIQQGEHHRNIIYRSREWCMEKQILPFSSMIMNLDTGENHKKRTDTK